MNDSENPDDDVRMRNIVFIQIPPSMTRDLGGFILDPAIPIPVETGLAAERWKPDDLTWEMIVAGMLRFLAARPGHRDAPYYRAFVLAVKPGIFGELMETGIIKARNRDFDIAEEIFLALTSLYPEEAGPLSNLASVYEERSDALSGLDKNELAEAYSEKAFETYRRLLSFDEVPAESYMNAACFFLKQRNYPRAKELFETYVKQGRDPDLKKKARDIVAKLERQGLLDTLFKEAYDFITMGREEEGIARIKEFLESYPRVWNAWFLLGWANRRLGRWTEGKDAFFKAVEHGGDDVDTCNELAICLMELGDFAESRRFLEKALRIENENIKVISNLGVLAKRAGRLDEAAGFFRTVLDIEPDDPLALKELAGLKG